MFLGYDTGRGLHVLVFKVSQWLWVVSRCRPGELRMALNPQFPESNPHWSQGHPLSAPLVWLEALDGSPPNQDPGPGVRCMALTWSLPLFRPLFSHMNNENVG